MASVYLRLDDVGRARENLEQASTLDAQSPNLFFLQFKMAVVQNDSRAGVAINLRLNA